MSHKSLALFVLFLIITASVPCLSQVRSRIDASTEGVWFGKPLVTATVSKDQVRLTALVLTQRIRLEVLSQAGEPLYDSDFHPGNRLEWEVKDQQGSELRDGIYGCIVTVEDLNGNMSHRRGILKVMEGAVSFDTLKRETAASDEQENLTILRGEEPSPFTLVSHDGKEGWIESASGGLSFYAGSLSRSGDAVPHLRLTPDGNVGIGMAEPRAKLDVAGLVRASEGFQFSDGTILKIEGGIPVLVSERSNEKGESSTGATGKTTRMLAAGGNVGVLSVGGGFPGRVLSNETGSNTWFGEGAGASITTGTDNSFFGQNAGNKTSGGTLSQGSENSFFGSSAGKANTTGMFNAFFGTFAGLNNTYGQQNSFFGSAAGLDNTTGTGNSFFGQGAGKYNTTGVENAFFGMSAGEYNTTGSYNSFFGTFAGYVSTGSANSIFGRFAGMNTQGGGNSFFGGGTGFRNTTGYNNSFFGLDVGAYNTAGASNSFFGQNAGISNTTENNNSFIGAYSDGAVGITNATAVGYRAKVTQSNSLVLGGVSGVNGATADTNVGIGTTAPGSRLTVVGDIDSSTGYSIGGTPALRSEPFAPARSGNTSVGLNAGYGGMANSVLGSSAGVGLTTGQGNSIVGTWAGYSNTTGNFNSFFGVQAGFSPATGNNNSFIGAYSDGAADITNATALGYRAQVTQSNSLVLGSINGVNSATADTNVGIGVTAPKHRLHVESSFPNPAAGGRATYSYTYFTPISNNSGYIFGLESAARYTGQYNLTANHLAAGYALAALSGYYGGTVAEGLGGTGSVGTVTGVTAQNIMRSSITVNDAIGLQVQPAIADVGAATVTNVYGVYVKNPFNVTPTNVYGLYTENLTTGSNNYGVYVSGNSKSFFGGNVGIGTTSPTEKLHVIGNMRVSGSILYGAGEEPVPDYVFEPGYKLMTVEELGRYVEKEKHLPNVPAAAEIREKGLNLGELQMKLLEKIEELTIYAVQQAKTIREQQQRLLALEQMMDRLTKQK